MTAPISASAAMVRRWPRWSGVSRTMRTRRRRSLGATSAARGRRAGGEGKGGGGGGRPNRPRHRLWITCNRLEIGARWLIGLGTTLLPIPEGAERDVVARGKFFLCQTERPAQRLDAWHPSRRP